MGSRHSLLDHAQALQQTHFQLLKLQADLDHTPVEGSGQTQAPQP